MEFEWNADLVYQIVQNMEHVEECITIDSDISDDEEETPLTRSQVYEMEEMEESILPLSYIESLYMSSQVFDPLRIVDDSIGDSEIEVVYESKMPPLIPLTVPGNNLGNSMKHKTQSPISLQPSNQRRSLEDSPDSKLVTELKSLLECPVCSSIINISPVHCCSNGHLTCLPCWTRCHICPVCRVPCHSAPPCYSQTANNIIGLIPLPCENKYRGCPVEGVEGEIGKHILECPFRVWETRIRGCDELGCRVGH